MILFLKLNKIVPEGEGPKDQDNLLEVKQKTNLYILHEKKSNYLKTIFF